MDKKTHLLRYSDTVTNKVHRLRVRIMNSSEETCTVIAGRPGQEWIITNVPKSNLRVLSPVKPIEPTGTKGASLM